MAAAASKLALPASGQMGLLREQTFRANRANTLAPSVWRATTKRLARPALLLARNAHLPL